MEQWSLGSPSRRGHLLWDCSSAEIFYGQSLERNHRVLQNNTAHCKRGNKEGTFRVISWALLRKEFAILLLTSGDVG